MLNLSARNPATVSEVGYEFTVEMPDGTLTDAKIKVRGGMSKAVTQYGRKMFAEAQAKEKMLKRQGKEDTLNLEQLEEAACKSAVIRIISWSGLGIEEGKELPLTPENAEMIMKEYPFIREQVIKNSEDLSNFRF